MCVFITILLIVSIVVRVVFGTRKPSGRNKRSSQNESLDYDDYGDDDPNMTRDVADRGWSADDYFLYDYFYNSTNGEDDDSWLD